MVDLSSVIQYADESNQSDLEEADYYVYYIRDKQPFYRRHIFRNNILPSCPHRSPYQNYRRYCPSSQPPLRKFIPSKNEDFLLHLVAVSTLWTSMDSLYCADFETVGTILLRTVRTGRKSVFSSWFSQIYDRRMIPRQRMQQLNHLANIWITFMFPRTLSLLHYLV